MREGEREGERGRERRREKEREREETINQTLVVPALIQTASKAVLMYCRQGFCVSVT